MLEEWKIAKMQKAQYRVVGNHSAVKVCLWTKECLRGGRSCYKNSFYGISTARCMEMTPALTCNQRCMHCWRDTSIFSKEWNAPIDEPDEIITGCIEARKKLLTGFKGNEKTDKKLFEKAMEPAQVAISLTGEPCMYPKLPQLIKRFFESGFESVYLVTAGTVPEMLKKLKPLPTNFYISLTATNPEMYEKLCLPVIEGAWEKVMESLELMRKMKTTTVLRLTLIKGLNMEKPEEFAPLVEKAKPKFIECKAYMFLGCSRKRLKSENMPEMEDIRAFAKALAKAAGYKVKAEREDSRVVLLEKP
ncbi:MAG: 4-demethylwyosine synthase TYW1 [Candidatus Diapherotrites archaeon]|nr:4-demethylwyosine synthase TYW1 [Candidatus Diapherotrites archaeon]